MPSSKLVMFNLYWVIFLWCINCDINQNITNSQFSWKICNIKKGIHFKNTFIWFNFLFQIGQNEKALSVLKLIYKKNNPKSSNFEVSVCKIYMCNPLDDTSVWKYNNLKRYHIWLNSKLFKQCIILFYIFVE